MPTESRWSGQVAELAPLVMGARGTHAVQLYEDDAFLIAILARVVREGLELGEGVVVCATARHREALARRLHECGVALGDFRDQERYVEVDTHELLADYADGGGIDGQRFACAVGRSLDRAEKATTGGRVRVFGEMVAVLWSEGRRDDALEVERLWNGEILARPKLSLLCAYPLAAFASHDDTPRFEAMCRHHSHVAPSESYAVLDSASERLRAIAVLQQKAVVLAGELTRASDAGFVVICKRCGTTVLRASRIGTGEAEAVEAHLRAEHAGILSPGSPMLGEILREVVIREG